MSAATAAKPPATGTPRRDAPSRAAAPSPAAASRPPARSSTPTAASAGAGTSSPSSVARTRSVRTGSASSTPVSARAAVKKAAAPSTLSREAEADSQEAQALYVQALQERVQKAESAAESGAKQLQVLHARLDEAHGEQARLEERAHEEEEKAEALERQRRELMRQQRELEAIYEAERAQSMREKEATQAREDALHDTIQRLKEAAAAKSGPSGEGDDEPPARAASFRNTPSRNNSSQHLDKTASFAPPSSMQRSNSRSNAKLINQKDKIIEDLRLELAEYQVKLLDVESAGGGRLRELEKQLLDTRMTNARLMEDNESFQLLLGEKTLSGDFLRHAHAPPSASLADELQSVEEADVEAVRRLEAEVASVKEQNKALTLYINKIIGRLLTHQGFESVLGNDADADPDRVPNTNKELPPPPPKENDPPQGFLQRAKSVMGTTAARKPRPTSIMGPPAVPTVQQSANEDPATAPSIPLARPLSTRVPSSSYSHRRSTSEAQANTIFRTASGPASPGLVSPRNSFFGLPVNGNSETTTRSINGGAPPPASLPGSRVPSATLASSVASLRAAAADDPDADSTRADTPSPPRRLERSETSSTGPMTGKGMRPLRLVQNEEEAMKARKAANRGSWFGGLFGQQQTQQQPQHQQTPLSPLQDGGS